MVTRWRDGSHGPGGVFAVDVASGELTRLQGAGEIYGASDPARGLVALSSTKAGTTVFELRS
jgi:hypothetical protein